MGGKFYCSRDEIEQIVTADQLFIVKNYARSENSADWKLGFRLDLQCRLQRVYSKAPHLRNQLKETSRLIKND